MPSTEGAAVDVRGVRRVALALAPLVVLASAGAATGAPQQRAEPGPPLRPGVGERPGQGRRRELGEPGDEPGRPARGLHVVRAQPGSSRARRPQQADLPVGRPHGPAPPGAQAPARGDPRGRRGAGAVTERALPGLLQPRPGDRAAPTAGPPTTASRSGPTRTSSSPTCAPERSGAPRPTTAAGGRRLLVLPQVADTGDVVFSSCATDLVRGDDRRGGRRVPRTTGRRERLRG